MDLKTYEKTRYQNIYRNKKNKNYIIQISKPAKTTISSVDGKKILKLEEAIKIRDNEKIRLQRGTEARLKEDFDSVWDKYMYACENELKLAYNTILRKKKMYNKYIKGNLEKKLSKLTKKDLIYFVENMDTTLKQKNEMIRLLKAFFNWCVKEEYLVISPATFITQYKIQKNEMKYWTPDELKKILNVLGEDIKSNNFDNIKRARLIKVFILIEFSLGDRVGETRALTYDCFDEVRNTVKINHSINYDRKDTDFLSNTKNYHSQRTIDISNKLIEEVKEYKKFLSNYYDVKDTNLIFFNYSTNKPYSDVSLRKKFYYYCDKAKVTKIRMYDLRHTYVATMMAEGKELYHISARIGHSNYSTTVNKYGHLSHEVKRELAETTDKYL